MLFHEGIPLLELNTVCFEFTLTSCKWFANLNFSNENMQSMNAFTTVSEKNILNALNIVSKETK